MAGRTLGSLLGGSLASLVLATAIPAAASEAPTAAACAAGVTVAPPEPVWRGAPAGPTDWGGRLGQPVTESRAADGLHLFNVTTPTYEAFLPAPGCATGAAVMVAPGGGFWLLAIENEGRDVAHWLAARGIAAFVLKYRLVQYDKPYIGMKERRTLPDGVAAAAAVADGRETLRLIRAQASRFAIDPARVGAIGFSAGGHLVMTLMLDQPATRPAFVGNIYGAFFQTTMPAFPAAQLPRPADAPKEFWLGPEPEPAPGALPPLFMAIAQDDRAVRIGFDDLELALRNAGYRPELHRYAKGGHGFGMRKQGLTSDGFMDDFRLWLQQNGLLAAAKDVATAKPPAP